MPLTWIPYRDTLADRALLTARYRDPFVHVRLRAWDDERIRIAEEISTPPSPVSHHNWAHRERASDIIAWAYPETVFGPWTRHTDQQPPATPPNSRVVCTVHDEPLSGDPETWVRHRVSDLNWSAIIWYATATNVNDHDPATTRAHPRISNPTAPRPAPSPPPRTPTAAQKTILAGLAPWAQQAYKKALFFEDTLPPWHAEPWAQHEPSDPRFLHFAHISHNDPRLLAYTKSPAHGELGQRLPIKPGRYLTQFYGDTLTPEQIKHWASCVRGTSMSLHITTDPKEIIQIYGTVGVACMSHSTRHYRSAAYNGGLHPTISYTKGDLAVAYLAPEATAPGLPKIAVARAVVWPARKLYSRAYGDSEAMRAELDAQGYTAGPLDGARIWTPSCSREMHLGAVTCPYVDHVKWARLDGDFLILQSLAQGATHSVNHGDGVAYPIATAPMRPISPLHESPAQEHARLVALETGQPAPPTEEAQLRPSRYGSLPSLATPANPPGVTAPADRVRLRSYAEYINLVAVPSPQPIVPTQQNNSLDAE